MCCDGHEAGHGQCSVEWKLGSLRQCFHSNPAVRVLAAGSEHQ